MPVNDKCEHLNHLRREIWADVEDITFNGVKRVEVGHDGWGATA